MRINRTIVSSLIIASLLGISAASLHAETPAPEGKFEITGTIVQQDGQPAAGAIIEYRVPVDSTAEIRADENGKFKLSDDFTGGCVLHVLSPDGRQQATRFIEAAAVREESRKPIDIKLEPAVERLVTVLSATGERVAEAQVAARVESYQAQAVTGADGQATLLLPAGKKLDLIQAWHPQLGAANVRNERGLTDSAFELKLYPAAPHTIKIVDEQGQPAPGLSFEADVRVDSQEWVTTWSIAASHLITDAQGEATATWLPRTFEYMNLRIHRLDWKVNGIERDKTNEDRTIVRARRKLEVVGRLKMPDGASAEGILIDAVGFGPHDHCDIPTARAAADGSFRLLVAPDHGYGINIVDSRWASDGWSGLILSDEKATPSEISMDVYRGTPLEVRVTHGPEHTPLAGAPVSLSGEQHIRWCDARGKKRSAMFGHQYYVRTDASGVAHTCVSRGKLEMRIFADAWDEIQEFYIKADTPKSVEFHWPWIGPRKVVGHLTLNGAPYKPSPTATIVAEAAGPIETTPAPERLKATLHEDGAFEVEGDAREFTICVKDPEARVAGCVYLGQETSEVDLTLTPTAVFRGVLVDQEDHPLPGRSVRLMLVDDLRQESAEQVTDDQGRFQFDAVTANLTLYLQWKRDVGKWKSFGYVSTVLFRPGETREGERFQVDERSDEQRRQLPEPNQALPRRLAETLRMTRPTGLRTLVVLQADDSIPNANLVERVTDHNAWGYNTLGVKQDSLRSDAVALHDLTWPLPQTGEVVLVVLDHEGKSLGAERLKTNDLDGAERQASEFLKAHMPPGRDAWATLLAAREEAKRTQRQVWVTYYGAHGGNFFFMAQWMESKQALLEKDYVLVNVRERLDQNVEQVLTSLNQPLDAVTYLPWFAITDPAGKILITSEGPSGSAGRPYSFEDSRYLRQMLEKTSHNLTADEIDRITKPLVGFR